MLNHHLPAAGVLCACAVTSVSAASGVTDHEQLALHQAPQLHLEEIYVEGEHHQPSETVGTTATVMPEDLAAINITTVEDAISYQPNLVVRRRYIGDPNGSVGIRGSNMFQTARTLVYADGLPLHYHLQTRWSGAPRWSLIAPEEIATVDVIYGPYSAAYSGNAMGGVVRVTTQMPSERSLTVRGTLFDQHFQKLNTDEHYSGGKLGLTYGDVIEHLSFFALYNRLQNDGQPMTQFAAPAGGPTPDAPPVFGAVIGSDNQGQSVVYYGDSGAEATRSDLVKLKAQLEGERVEFRTTLAYEDRLSETRDPNNFVITETGEEFWSGSAQLDEHAFTVDPANFALQEQQRRSLLGGIGATAPLGRWSLDINLSHFEILEDVATSSLRHPQDTDFTPAGRLTAFHDTGWTTLDASATVDKLGERHARLLLGVHYDTYRLGLRSFDYDDLASREGAELRSASGGRTETAAAYIETQWQIHPLWVLTLGARYETWRASDGYTDDTVLAPRTESGLSPKLSLDFAPREDWLLRYSFAQALRFPIVEELYQNESRTRSLQTANAHLQPEDGLHNNWMIEKKIPAGFIRINFFQESVDNTIFNQLGVVNGTEVSTFLGIDQVTTRGTEFILNQANLFNKPVDLRFNLSYVDARITRNDVNPTLEGNRFPRLPRWQSNLLLSYRWSRSMSLSGGARYASNSYGELDNSDSAQRTFGAHDEYLFFNVRGQWQVNPRLDIALGIDNLTNQTAYVHHPWPSRTLYLEAGYVF